MGRPIPALDDALDGAALLPALEAVARERCGAGTRVESLRADVLKRRVLRLALALAGGAAPRECAVIAKVYESAALGAAAFETHRWIARHAFSGSRSSGVPEALAYVPAARALLMEEVGGDSLRALVKRGRVRSEHLARAADALADLHLCPEALGAPLGLEHHLERRCAGLAEPLARALPDAAPALARVLACARRLGVGPSAVAHGDFHPGQLHLDGEKTWILDLDPLHQGDPAYDVAMMLVQLELARAAGAPIDARALSAAFLERYVARAGSAGIERLPIQCALILLKRACKRFRYQDEPGWEATARRQLERGAALAELQEERGALGTVGDAVELLGRMQTVA